MKNISWIISFMVLITISHPEETFSNYSYPLPSITSDSGVIVLTTHEPYQWGCDVQCGGTITDDGGLPVLQFGVCWSINPDPTLADNHTNNNCSLWQGSFDCLISEWDLGNIDPWQPLYFKAYAINDSGTYYGDEKQFILMPPMAWINQSIIELTPTSITFQREIYFDYGYQMWCQSLLYPPGSEVVCDNGGCSNFQICQVVNLSPSTDYTIETWAFVSCSFMSGEYYDYLYFTTPPLEVSVTTSQLNGIKIYPNPTNDNLFINFEDQPAEEVRDIKIFNTLGKMVYNEKVDFSVKNTTINLQNLKPGIYYLRISGVNRNIMANHKISVVR